MANPKAIIADDEEQLRIYLRSKLSGLWPELDICAEAENGLKALELIDKKRPEIAFLDINMPGLSGLEVAKNITFSCRVVFITAYDQYAIEAFENEAIDYLLKPVTDDRLLKTIKRLQKQIADTSPSPIGCGASGRVLGTKPDLVPGAGDPVVRQFVSPPLMKQTKPPSMLTHHQHFAIIEVKCSYIPINCILKIPMVFASFPV